jgi:hypothetical protein
MRIVNWKRYVTQQKSCLYSAYVVMHGEKLCATIAIKYPRDGAATLIAQAVVEGKLWEGRAGGYGYAKDNAAMAGLCIGGKVTLADNGIGWTEQLAQAGYRVIQAL